MTGKYLAWRVVATVSLISKSFRGVRTRRLVAAFPHFETVESIACVWPMNLYRVIVDKTPLLPFRLASVRCLKGGA